MKQTVLLVIFSLISIISVSCTTIPEDQPGVKKRDNIKDGRFAFLEEEKKAAREHREAELLPHISAHILRHTACTRMAEQGLDPKVLQYIMGHSDISVTMNVYNHVDKNRVENEMQKIAKIG